MTNHSGLKLHVNEALPKSLKTSCTIKMNNEVNKFNDFVTVGHNQVTGETTMHTNADAVTLGQALRMISNAFETTMDNLSKEQQAEVMSVL
jgi:hypothetical protein